MAWSNTATAVVGAAVALATAPNANVTDPTPILIFNNAAAGDVNNTLFVGGSGVTTVNGLPVLPQTGISYRLMQGETVYGISNGTSLDVRVMKGRQ